MKNMRLKALCLVLGAGMLWPAVGQSATELRMSWWGGNQRHQATTEAIKAFEAQNPDVKINTEPSGWDGYLSRLSTQLAGNTEPDVMQINWNWLVMFSKNGDGFYDIQRQSAAIDLSQFSSQGKQLVTVNGKLNGVPVAMTGRSMYYNPELWKKAGVAYPQTWEQMIAAGPAFKNTLGDDYYPFILANHDTTIMTFLNSYMVQKYNIPMIDPQKKNFTYSREQWLDYFGMYKKLVDNHVIPSMKYLSSFGKANAWEIKPWLDGKIGGVHTWSTDGTFAGSLRPPAHLEVGPYPMLPGATDAGIFFKPAMMFSIGKNSKHPELAAKLINFLLNDPQGIKAMGLQRGVPLSAEAVKVLQQDGVLDNGQIQVQGLAQVDQLMGKIEPSPWFENPQLLAYFLDAVQRYDYGQLTLEQLADEFPQRAQRVLKKIM